MSDLGPRWRGLLRHQCPSTSYTFSLLGPHGEITEILPWGSLWVCLRPWVCLRRVHLTQKNNVPQSSMFRVAVNLGTVFPSVK